MANANLRNFPEIANLKLAEKDTIIALSVDYEGQFDLIQEEFQKKHGKPLTREVLEQIQAKYAERIKALETEKMDKIFRVPLSRRGSRLRLLWKIYKEAEKIKPIYSVRTEEGYALHEGPNFKVQIACILAAEKIMSDGKRLDQTERQIQDALGTGEQQESEVNAANTGQKTDGITFGSAVQ